MITDYTKNEIFVSRIADSFKLEFDRFTITDGHGTRKGWYFENEDYDRYDFYSLSAAAKWFRNAIDAMAFYEILDNLDIPDDYRLIGGEFHDIFSYCEIYTIMEQMECLASDDIRESALVMIRDLFLDVLDDFIENFEDDEADDV